MTDTVTVTTPVADQADDHEAQMAAKFDAGTGTPPVDPAKEESKGDELPQRPEWLPEKFKSPEDMAKAYAELESKLGQKGDEGEPEGDTETPAEDQAKAAVENAGLDFDALSAEYEEKGDLTPESYEKLAKAGITKDIVDQYIAGVEAIKTNLANAAFSVAGGEEQYNAMVTWAATNMTQAEIEAYDKAVNSTNPDVIKMAVMGLKGRYETVNGSEPQLLSGDVGAVSGAKFESWAQVREAMRDPKYSKDPAYRAQVEAKLARSTPI